MRHLLRLTPLLLVAGCVTAPNQAAICDGSQAARTAHAAALAEGGDGASVVTGARLIAILDAGCGDTKGH